MSRGFTLVELMVTLAIVGVLASAALPLAEVGVRRVREQQLHEALRTIRTALDAYRQAVEDGRIVQQVDRSGYPPSLKTLVDGVPDAGSPDRRHRLYFLRRIPRDPLCQDPALADEDTWGKRDYQSGADDPQPGEQVYDVYSQAPGLGLNGIAYRNW
jgi:general secretion pathway protein G